VLTYTIIYIQADLFLSMYMFLEAVVETAGDCLWQNEKFLYSIITQILTESDAYGRDAIVISVVGKMNMGSSKCSDYWYMTLKLVSE